MKKNICYYCIIVTSILTTLVTSFKLKSMFFFVWLIIPYIITGLFSIRNSESPLKNIVNYIALVLILVGGLYFIVDVIYIHPDPQGGIALFILPPIQIFAYGIMVALYDAYKNYKLK